MIKFFCDYCSAEISSDTIAKRHLSDSRIREQRHFCSREHQATYRKQHGEYKEISAKGRAARSMAVGKSNRDNPRRKRKGAPIFA